MLAMYNYNLLQGRSNKINDLKPDYQKRNNIDTRINEKVSIYTYTECVYVYTWKLLLFFTHF